MKPATADEILGVAQADPRPSRRAGMSHPTKYPPNQPHLPEVSSSRRNLHCQKRFPVSKPVLAILFAIFLPAALALAQSAPDAPVPAALRTGTKIFVSNAGADSGLFPSPFSGDPNRGYNQLYAGLKANGQYELVGDPSQADLVLELQLTAPVGSTRSMNTNKVNGASDPVPMFRLVIYDCKTHFVLWTFTQSIEVAILQKTHDHNFDDALTAILLEFEAITGKAQNATH
jgi:hypothetical protein